jgi:adenylate cyclase
MAPEGFKRKLAAILSADVEGYSRLMDDDEEATVHTLTAYRTAIADLVQQFRGRIVDTPGDNILADFPSVVDSVNCAVEIQRDLAERNIDLSYHRQMQFRIGVNLGDVIEEDGRIYGDGVNIAARVESIADAGGICISGRAFDQVENKLGLEYENFGEHQVKNITRPIRVFRVLSHPGAAAHRVVQARETREPAPVEKMTFPLPEKPSIAVLPFDNMSGDPGQDYLADGISENIITALSYIPEMFVIARNSSFTYKGKPVKVQQVSEELGVRYVLEGSVMKSADKVRITAQLIDALSGGHMWSERWDRDLKDLFSLLDEITRAVTVALQVELTDGEQARSRSGSTQNFEAWGYIVKAKSIFHKFGKEDMVRTRELCEKATKIDPQNAGALLLLAWTHKIDAHLEYTDSKAKSLQLSVELAKKSVAMNDKDPNVHSLLSLLSLIQGDHEKAVEEGRKAIALGPSESDAHLLFGEVLYQTGNFKQAVKMCERALRLHPFSPLYYLGHTLNAYYWVGRYDESLALAERLIDQSRKVGFEWGVAWGLYGSALAKTKTGQLSEARQDADEILKIWPWFNLDYFRSIHHYKNSAHEEQVIDGLRMAEIPEQPPSQ